MNDDWKKNIRLYLDRPELLPEHERAFFTLLIKAHRERNKVHQRDFARVFSNLGSHELHEEPRRDSTLRKVRQIIRNLRLNHGVPILSDAAGYWLPRSFEEVAAFVKDLRKKAKAMTKAYFDTYTAVRNTTGITDSYFDAQQPLFDTSMP